MNINRRDFVKGCAAVYVLSLPVVAGAAKAASASNALASSMGPDLEKSIKAGFGGGFSLRAHKQVNGLTYAHIEHAGNQYAVASANSLDWQIVETSLGKPSFAFSSVG